MEIVRVNGLNEDFVMLTRCLEDFQYNFMPVLKDKGYELVSDLCDVDGYVLYVDDKPIGSIGLKKISEDCCEIVRVFVLNEYRGNGYAVMLFEKIEKLAREKGFKEAEMVAWSLAKSALKLYDKLGYVKSEEKISEWFSGFGYVELHKNL